MGHDSHFVLQFSSVFSVGMYICSVLQMATYREGYQQVIAEMNRLKAENDNLKSALETV